MAIQLNDNLEINAPKPIRTTDVVGTGEIYATKEDIPTAMRFEGLRTFDGTDNWQLQCGIDDTNWTVLNNISSDYLRKDDATILNYNLSAPIVTGTIYISEGSSQSGYRYGLVVNSIDITSEFPIGTPIVIRDNIGTVLGYRTVSGNYYSSNQNQIYYYGEITGTIYDFAEVDGFNYEPVTDYGIVNKLYLETYVANNTPIVSIADNQVAIGTGSGIEGTSNLTFTNGTYNILNINPTTDASGVSALNLYTNVGSSTLSSLINIYKSRGTKETPEAILNTSTLGGITFNGYDGSEYIKYGSIYSNKLYTTFSHSNFPIILTDSGLQIGTSGEVVTTIASTVTDDDTKLVTSKAIYNAISSVTSSLHWTEGTDKLYTTDLSNSVAIGTTTPLAKLHVIGSTVFEGSSGDITVSGNGTRMIWSATKAAIRAGTVLNTEWDNTNIGEYSAAFGIGCIASGLYSFSTGNSATASGNSSTAIGKYVTADSFNNTVIGAYNIGGGSATTWVGTDPIFEIGIGTNSTSKANATTVLKNGDIYGHYNLHLTGGFYDTSDSIGTSGQILTSTATGTTWTDGLSNYLPYTGATTNVNLGSNYLLIGDSTTKVFETSLELANNEGSDSDVAVILSASSGSPELNLARSRGTVDSPTDVQTGDMLGINSFHAYYNGQYRAAASIIATYDSNDGDVVTSKLSFYNSSSNKKVISDPGIERVAISGDGDLYAYYNLIVSGKINSTNINVSQLDYYIDNDAAIAGGLVDGDIYYSANGIIRVVYPNT